MIGPRYRYVTVESRFHSPCPIRDSRGSWVLRAGGAVLGESSDVIELTEGDYPTAIYIPRNDIAMAFLDVSDTTSVCPHKGTATYYSIQTKSTLFKDAGWSYETPQDGLEAIAGHISFYPNRATVEQL